MIPSSKGLSEVFGNEAGVSGARPSTGPGPPHQTRERARSGANGRHWLIVKDLPHDGEVFAVGGGKLAVFSFREEAEAFLGSRGSGDGWQVEEFWAEDLVSMLHGPLSGFGSLALDPLPEIEDRAVDSLVSVGREEFVGLLASRSRPLSLRPTED